MPVLVLYARQPSVVANAMKDGLTLHLMMPRVLAVDLAMMTIQMMEEEEEEEEDRDQEGMPPFCHLTELAPFHHVHGKSRSSVYAEIWE